MQYCKFEISIVRKPQTYPNVLTQVKLHTLHGRDIAMTEKLSQGRFDKEVILWKIKRDSKDFKLELFQSY